jgi:hypothetical protein
MLRLIKIIPEMESSGMIRIALRQDHGMHEARRVNPAAGWEERNKP